MTDILLIYPPFCTPATPPYSITNIHAFLKQNDQESRMIDLNLFFHRKIMKNEFKSFKNYEANAKEFLKTTKTVYSKNNIKIVKDEQPDLFDKCLNQIIKHDPKLVAFSVVYSSQVFYTYALIKELNKQNIKTIIGGPATSHQLESISTFVKDKYQLLSYLKLPLKNDNNILDFKHLQPTKYFSPSPIIPIKTASTCYYQRCAFCAHHKNQKYKEYNLNDIKITIKNSKQKYFFIIDDMIHKKRLLDFAKAIAPLKIKWVCQLKPTKDFDKHTLTTLKATGLQMIIWGVESGSNRILKLMRKGTNKEDMRKVLKASKQANITNVLYIMFGFPTETKEEFLETINFLKYNQNNIDLISTSIFGLQQQTPIFNHPKEFKITKIKHTKRTLLEPKLSYNVSAGLTNDEAKLLRQKYKRTINNINKFPKAMNFFRGHMLLYINNKNNKKPREKLMKNELCFST